MDEQRVRILLVEDDEAHVTLIRRVFGSRAKHIHLTVAGNLAEARSCLSRSLPDLVLADLMLPDGRGTELLLDDGEERSFPIVVMTSYGNERIAVQAMKDGALDYVVKSATTLVDMPRIVERALREWGHIVERKQAEKALRESEEKYRDLVENIAEVIYAVDGDGVVTYISPVIEPFIGYSPSEVIGHPLRDFIHQQDLPRFDEGFQSLLAGRATTNECRIITKSGDLRWMHTSSRPILEEDRVTGVQGVLVDITESKRAEQAMIQASRLEATATLAGGVAHKVNNLMVVVLGYAELLQADFVDQPDVLDMLVRIAKSAEQTGELATQLLTFARGGRYQPRVINLNHTIGRVLRIQEHVMPSRICVEPNMEPDLWDIEADPAQMGQVFLSLFTNALEAIESNGHIVVTTGNVMIDQDVPDLKPGPYVCLVVQDTGHGISAEARDKVFEPFFTTKFQGRGLGLAAAYGVVRHHGGHITVHSEEGRGATFTVYLPALRAGGGGLSELESTVIAL